MNIYRFFLTFRQSQHLGVLPFSKKKIKKKPFRWFLVDWLWMVKMGYKRCTDTMSNPQVFYSFISLPFKNLGSATGMLLWPRGVDKKDTIRLSVADPGFNKLEKGQSIIRPNFPETAVKWRKNGPRHEVRILCSPKSDNDCIRLFHENTKLSILIFLYCLKWK